MTRKPFPRLPACLALALVALAAPASEAQVVRPKIVTKPNPNAIATRPYVPKYKNGTTPLNQGVLQYAQSKLGQQVGRGECWDLVDQALRAAGAQPPGQGSLGSYQFGDVVPLDKVLAGDVLQFEGVVFKGAKGNGTYTNNFPHHTAIVSRPLVILKGRQIEVLHQNVNGDRRVQTGVINLDDQQGGTLVAYRPYAKK